MVLIPGVRRLYINISLDIFEFYRFPGNMHMESSAYILHLLLEYNEGIWTGLYVVDISWEIPILTFPATNSFYAMSNTFDSNLPVTVHIYSDVTTLVQCNRIPLKIYWNYNGTQWKYIHMTKANFADSFWFNNIFSGFRSIVLPPGLKWLENILNSYVNRSTTIPYLGVQCPCYGSDSKINEFFWFILD